MSNLTAKRVDKFTLKLLHRIGFRSLLRGESAGKVLHLGKFKP
jgi:hypothetical protein